MVSLSAAGIAAALCAVLVRQRAPEMAALTGLAACCFLLWRILPTVEEIRTAAEELAAQSGVSLEVLRPLLQTMGLALLTRLSSAFCRDAGESGLAAFLELAGAAAAVAAALPLLEQVLRLVSGLL